MVMHLIREARADNTEGTKYWHNLARSLAGELDHYYHQSKLIGRIARRYRDQYELYKKHAAEMENLLREQLNRCDKCDGFEDRCAECAESWVFLQKTPHIPRIVEIGKNVPNSLEE